MRTLNLTRPTKHLWAVVATCLAFSRTGLAVALIGTATLGNATSASADITALVAATIPLPSSGIGDAHTVDTLGLFGPAGAYLDGDTMTMTFTFDPTGLCLCGGSPTYAGYTGNYPASVTISINGHDALVSQLGQFASVNVAFNTTPGAREFKVLSNNNMGDSALFDIGGPISPDVADLRLYQSFSETIDPQTVLNYSYFTFDITVGGVRETVNAGPESLRFAYNAPLPGEAVPNPSTWTMLVLGFVGLGFIRCRQPKKDTSAAAAA